MKMTAEEFKELRAGNSAPEEIQHAKDLAKMQEAIDAMRTKDFLIGRTTETIKVPISGLGGSKDIEIRARLSKAEMKQHKSILQRWDRANGTDINFIESEEDERNLAVLLAHITTDASLNSEFWLSPDLDPQVADRILMEYFIAEPARRLLETQKFLGERLRTGVRTDVTSMGD